MPEPWELNNTARAGIELLFFNRVPKVGSQTFMELLRRLSLKNQFGKLLLFVNYFCLSISVPTINSLGRYSGMKWRVGSTSS